MKKYLWFVLPFILFLACGKLADQSGIIDRNQIRNTTLWTVVWEPYQLENVTEPSEKQFNPNLPGRPSRNEQDLIEQVDMYLNAKYRITTVETDRARGILALSMPKEHGMYRRDIADVIVHVKNKEDVTLALLKVFQEEDLPRVERQGIEIENLGDLTAYMIFEMVTSVGY